MLNFKIYEQRYEELNKKRLELAWSVMPEETRTLFDLVPILLHYNHPLLSGYQDQDVPHGIYGFKTNESQQKFLDRLSSMSGNLRGFQALDESILALYFMGSTSSIGQSPKSDIDYWVCISHHISDERIKLLEQKCNFISTMAKNRGVEINFFIVKDNKFKEVNNDIASEDSCGSTQHMFLLDEFYRSAVRVAGKKLLWMIIPSQYEANYQQCVKELYQSKQINKDDWLDFGNIGQIPTKEYYGSALWLMYKGIDSPFKAVLKILLIEAYSVEYPNTRLISFQIKEWMQSHATYSLELDAYYMVFQKVCNYLMKTQDFERLDLVRLCFYQKLYDGLKKMDNHDAILYRRGVIKQLIDSWNWTEDDVSFIENSHRWRIPDVRKIYNMLFNALMQSYSSLLSFGITNKVSDSIQSVDISVLSRKLYVAFDSVPGKIKIYNLNIGHLIEETHLSFIEVRDSHIFRDGWYLYSSTLQAEDIIGKKPLSYHTDIGTMLVSCFFNGVMSVNTNVELSSQYSNIAPQRIYMFLRDLTDLFNEPQVKATNEDLLSPATVTKLGIFVNFSQDPTTSPDYRHVGRSEKNVNVFSAGARMSSMVGSVLVVFTNSWNEIYCYNYEGDLAIFNFIHEMNYYFHRGDCEPPVWHLYNYSQHMRAYISSQTSELVKNCLNGISSKLKSSFELKLNSEDYIIAFDERYFDISLKVYSSDEDPFADLYAERLRDIPSIIESHSTYGCIQYFFAKKDNGCYDIFEVDEGKNIKVYRGFNGVVYDLVHNINNYYSKKLDLGNKKFKYKQYFNLPQFYEVDIQKEAITPLTN